MEKAPVNWTNRLLFSLTPLFAITLVPLYGFFYGYDLYEWAVFALLMVFCGMSITTGYHRLWPHKAYKAYKAYKAHRHSCYAVKSHDLQAKFDQLDRMQLRDTYREIYFRLKVQRKRWQHLIQNLANSQLVPG